MRVLILMLMLLVFGNVSKAQDAEAMKQQRFIFENATLYNDPVVARTALYNMLALDPTNNDLLDSLAVFYFEYGQYASAAIVAKEAQNRNPENILALEIAAISFESLNIKDRALTEYESLFLKNNNTFTLYKIAFLQYDLERFNESNTSADILLRRKEVNEATVAFQRSDETQQSVPMSAAVYNLKGIIAVQQDKKDQAAEYFNKALEIVPDFELVQNNLKDVNEG
ncbi:MAG: tetratricopeptide repeat protein [Bacteroidota bacterium]